MGLGWRPVADPGMPPAPIVEDFDIFEQCCFGLPPGAELCSMNKLRFERAEERFHRCIVIAVALAAHGDLDAVAVEDLAIRPAGVLDATIGMVDEALRWSAMLDRHHQRVLAQRTPQMVGHAPADDLAGRHVLDGGQVQPALISRHIRNVRQPDRVWAIGLEGALEKVRGDAVAVPAVIGGRFLRRGGRMPFSLMSRATRLRAMRTPRARSSAWT